MLPDKEIKDGFSKALLIKLSNKESKFNMSMTDSLQILAQNLQWLGIIAPENSSLAMKFIRFAFPIFAHIMAIDFVIICIIHLRLTDENLQLSLANVFVVNLSLLVWYSINIKDKSLIKAIKLFQKVSKYYKKSNYPSHWFLKIMLIINVIIIFPFSFLFFI